MDQAQLTAEIGAETTWPVSAERREQRLPLGFDPRISRRDPADCGSITALGLLQTFAGAGRGSIGPGECGLMVDHVEAVKARSGGYWDDLAQAGSAQFAFPLWRRYCDQLHGRWLLSWLEGRTFAKVLKTDLFDEALGDGLVDVLASLTRPSGECHGVDVSPVLVARALQRHPGLTVHCGDVRCLPLAADQFDLVVSDSTLDHFQHPAEFRMALMELHRVMVSGGLLALTLDNPHHPLVALRNRWGRGWMGRSALLPYFVGHTLALKDLSRELCALGFELLCDCHLMHAPRLLALHLSRLLPTYGPVPDWFLQGLLAVEGLDRLPTARFSGHFVAILARKPIAPSTGV
jgi:SAM-dependent methyltransferase